MPQTKTPDRASLTQAQREVLTLAEQGKTAVEIAHTRGVRPNTVHVMFRTLRAAGFDVGKASASRRGNGGSRRRRRNPAPASSPAPSSNPTPPRGVEAVQAEIDAQAAALAKDRDNAQEEAKRLREEADKLDKVSQRLSADLEAIERSKAALKQ